MSEVLALLAPGMRKAKMSCHNRDPLALVPGVPPPPMESLYMTRQKEPITNMSIPQLKILRVLARTRMV